MVLIAAAMKTDARRSLRRLVGLATWSLVFATAAIAGCGKGVDPASRADDGGGPGTTNNTTAGATSSGTGSSASSGASTATAGTTSSGAGNSASSSGTGGSASSSGTGGSASSSGTGGSASSSGTGSGASSGGSTATTNTTAGALDGSVSIPPGIPIVYDLDASLPGLRITHSNYLWPFNWVGVIANDTQSPVCSINVKATLTDKARFFLDGLTAGVSTNNFDTLDPARWVLQCIPAGGIGAASGVFSRGTTSPDVVAQMLFTISGRAPAGALPKDDWVTLSSLQLVTVSSGGRGLRGKVTVGATALSAWRIDVYPKDANGTPLKSLTATHPNTGPYAVGAVLDFETDGYDGAFDAYYAFPAVYPVN